MSFSVSNVRAQFPALNENPVDEAGTQAVFFDNPAGTQVPQQVIDAVTHCYKHGNMLPGGRFHMSEESAIRVHETRRLMADFLGATDAEEIVFGPNMTALNFRLSRALARTLQPGDEIVLTRMDHDANISPWLLIAEDHDLTVRWVDINIEDATLDMDSLEAALSDRTKIVATVHASNAVGTINPVQRIAEMAHAAGAYHVVDAVQSAPHIPIDVCMIDCDFLLCSGYKFFGPHIGVMYGKRHLLESLPVDKVRPAKDAAPDRWENGMNSFEAIAGLRGALEYLAAIGREHGMKYTPEYEGAKGWPLDFKAGMEVIRVYERDLVAYLLAMLERTPKVNIFGITEEMRYEQRVPTVAFTVDGFTAAQVAEHLGEHHIQIWDGNYYAVEIMDALDHAEHGMARVGLVHYNTREEIDRLEAALQALIE
jgi:cysteine desulfurase family protein (TIGR01976 family)